MINLISRLIKKFLATGIHPEMHGAEQRRIRLLNFFYLVSTITFVAAVIETFIDEGQREGFSVLIAGVIFQLGLVPLLAKKTTFAEFYFLFMGNISLFIFNNMYGPEAGTYLYYFPYTIVIAFLVDFKKFARLFIHLGFTFSLIVLGFFLDHRFLYRPFPKEILQFSFNFNLLFSIIMMATVTVVIINMMYSQYNSFNRRMAEKNQEEESMKISIREKETLLAEVHHRVKNNLAVISSLLNLQMNQVNNEYTRNVLRESRNRVASMSLIHQKLYQNSNVEEIDFAAYATDLVGEIKQSYPDNTTDKIIVELDAEHILLSLTKAVPCGLLLNELLSNCYKHAFHGKNDGKIFIRFKKNNSH
ncbi:MAG TPA: sensor histidine kinase, partial [Bacteroidia bacterium]|nr:sensor histidine kinase [Bacteroidia bacterium]